MRTPSLPDPIRSSTFVPLRTARAAQERLKKEWIRTPGVMVVGLTIHQGQHAVRLMIDSKIWGAAPLPPSTPIDGVAVLVRTTR